MNNLRIIIILTIIALLSACWFSAEKTEVSTKNKETVTKQNTADQNAETKDNGEAENEQNNAETADDKQTETKIKPNNGQLTPTETLREFDAATIAKDAERIKKVITKKSLEYFEGEAKKMGMTFKQLVERPSQMPTVETPEMRNEVINGNKATVEAKNRFLGTFDKYPLVKEDGVWKVAYDVYLKQKIEELNKGGQP